MAGSFNYSKSGVLYNDEVVEIHRDGEILQDYSEIFESLWTAAKNVPLRLFRRPQTVDATRLPARSIEPLDSAYQLT